MDNFYYNYSFTEEEFNIKLKEYKYDRFHNYSYLDVNNMSLEKEMFKEYSSTNLCLYNLKNKMKNFITNNKIEVSDLGRVKINGKLVNQFQKKFGYLYINFGNKFDYPVYRLVGEVFCPCPVENINIHPKFEYWTVHHLTNNGFDNRMSNLLWMIKSDHLKLKHPNNNLEIRNEIKQILKENNLTKNEKLLLLDDLVALNKDNDLVKIMLEEDNINYLDYPYLFWNLKNT